MKAHLLVLAMLGTLAAHGAGYGPATLSTAATARGIAYTLAPDLRRPNPAFRYAFGVEYALGRGRLDVVDQIAKPAVLLDRVDFRPLARPGEYYLFDSTGFILVRPASHTFMRFAVTDAAYNFHNGRDGWPDMFPFRDVRTETVRANSGKNSPASPPVGPHGPLHLFWHVDFDQHFPGFQVVSRGRLTVVDAPFRETTVARWFGPTIALAALADEDSTWFPSDRLGLTAVELLPINGGTGNNFGLVQSLIGVRRTQVDVSRLILPSDYTEAGWGSPADSVGEVGSADRWKHPPHSP